MQTKKENEVGKLLRVAFNVFLPPSTPSRSIRILLASTLVADIQKTCLDQNMMSLQISCGWQRDMSGVPCRRRPRFDYTLSQSTWMKNTDLCQSQNGIWAERTGFALISSAVHGIAMVKPRSTRLSKMLQSTAFSQGPWQYLHLYFYLWK